MHEPLYGTASRVTNWLLIEDDGYWGADALLEGSLEPTVARALKAVADEHRIRALLIRRPRERTGMRACYAIHSGESRQWIQRLDVDDPRDLLSVDLSTMRHGHRPAAGAPFDGPIFLVCTHGEHDPCCARRGRAVADALLAGHGARTWESSHIGGDRFATNLVCLPHGLYFGRVPPEGAADTASLYQDGAIDLQHYRGRSCYDPVVQAADALIRLRERIAEIDELVLEERHGHAHGESTVIFRDRNGDRREVRVAVRRASKRRITCGATKEGAPREFRLVFGPPTPELWGAGT
jgi:hypothetical protein